MIKKILKFMLKFILPVIFEGLLLLAVYFMPRNNYAVDILVALSLPLMLCNAIIIPLYFVYIISKSYSHNCLILIFKFLLALFINACCCSITYVTWGISTGHLYSPDSETVLIINSEMCVAAAIFILSFVLLFVKRLRK